MPLDMVRGIPAILRDPLTWLEGAVERHGDLVAFPLPRTAVLLANTPAAARRVLQENHRNYTKQTVQYGALALVTGQGLLTSDGDPWRRHRRIMQPAFHPGGLGAVAGHTVTAAANLRRAFAAAGGAAVDADAASLHAMLELVGRTLFADDLAGAGERVVAAVDEALRVVLARARSPLAGGPLGRLPTPSRARLRRALSTLDDVTSDVVERRRRGGVGEPAAALLAVLLRAGDALEQPLTPAEIRDELVTLVIAGHETVASALTWTLYLLAGAPQVTARLHAELDQVLGGEPGWSDVPRLAYTRAVVDEALRLYPPAWIITRRSIAADTLDGVAIPAGTLVLVSPWLLHRRAQDWPDPLRFDPDRFADPAQRRSPAYLPFGAGPRLCIGRDFALLEATLVLATLLREASPRRPQSLPEPRVDALVTLRPHGGLPLHLDPR